MYNMQLNTGYAGKPHVTAENCADLNRGIVGSDSYVLPVGAQFEVELVTNNLLKIKDGCGCMQGRQVSIAKGQTDEITIENGTQGEKRIDLVVIRYSKNADTGIETAIPFLVKGIPSENNPVRPEHLEGDIRGGDLTADWPLYELYLDGISVTNVKPLFDVLMSVDSLNRNLPQGIPLSAEQSGVLALESARLKIIYGTYPLNAFISHQESGGYAKEFDISKYGLKDPVWGTASARYPNGHPHVFIGVVNANKLILLSDANVSDGYAHWMVIGNY